MSVGEGPETRVLVAVASAALAISIGAAAIPAHRAAELPAATLLHGE